MPSWVAAVYVRCFAVLLLTCRGTAFAFPVLCDIL